MILPTFLVFLQISTAVKVTQPTEIVQILGNPERYNRFSTPTQEVDKPTTVTIGIYIEGMSSIRAQTMDFHVDIYFEQRWEDLRLRHNSDKRVLVKDMGIYDLMWHPDLYFANANRAKFFDVTAPNFLLWIFPNGTVHHEMRISLTVICNMYLGKYPLDSQVCNMRLLSYAYTAEQLLVEWKTVDPIVINDQLRLPDMVIVNYTADYCDGTYALGTWSCLVGHISLQREIMHHVLQSYVPTMLIVVISWFSFWLDIDAVPGRVSLCITTLLTLATQASSARMALPQVSYAKAIDVWMEACLGFVFGVLIEFTGVNFLSRHGLEEARMAGEVRYKMAPHLGNGRTDPRDFSQVRTPPFPRAQSLAKVEQLEQTMDLLGKRSWDGEGLLNNTLDGRRGHNRKWRRLAIKIDKTCRLLFPMAFLFFNLIYWPYYLLLP